MWTVISFIFTKKKKVFTNILEFSSSIIQTLTNILRVTDIFLQFTWRIQLIHLQIQNT